MANYLFLVLVILFLFQCLHISFVWCHSTAVPPLLVIAFDGFRWDYLKRTTTPHFDKIIKQGVHARLGIKNVFPTVTLPNFFTLATGLYPESHGVIGNQMFDPDLNKSYSLFHPDPVVDQTIFESVQGEPIWVTNQRQNNLAKSGLVMWYGGDYSIKWTRPTFNMRHDENVTSERRIDIIIEWFTQKEPINLGMLYFDEPDLIAHKTGVESKNVTDFIKKADELIGYLMTSLKKKDLMDEMNIIITADHGMMTTSKDKLILLDDLIPQTWYEEIIMPSPLLAIIPNPAYEEKMFETLKGAADEANSHFKVWKKDDIPERFHYKHNRRVTPIIALADLSYNFIINSTVELFHFGGSHGYDNDLQEMHPFFLAMGPSFRKDFAIDTFDIVDVYPLMCHLLHLKPAANNGSMHIVKQFFASHETTNWTFSTYIFILIFISSVAGVFAVAACRQHRYLKRKLSQNRKSTLLGSMKYSFPSKGSAVVKLLSDDDDDDDDDDDFDEYDDGGKKISADGNMPSISS